MSASCTLSHSGYTQHMQVFVVPASWPCIMTLFAAYSCENPLFSVNDSKPRIGATVHESPSTLAVGHNGSIVLVLL